MVRFLGRKTRQLARARQQAYADRLMRQLDNSTKNCFHDCDFPGECFYQQNAGFENSESEAESDAPSLTLISDGRKGTNALDDSAEDFEIWVDPTDGDAQSPDERAETECHVSAAANFIE
jgi:hypothetical protein